MNQFMAGFLKGFGRLGIFRIFEHVGNYDRHLTHGRSLLLGGSNPRPALRLTQPLEISSRTVEMIRALVKFISAFHSGFGSLGQQSRDFLVAQGPEGCLLYTSPSP